MIGARLCHDRIRARNAAATLSLTFALFLFAPGAAGAAEPASSPKPPASVSGGTLSVTATPQWDGSLSLAARLTDAAGTPISGVTVDYFVAVEFFGDRRIGLGNAQTDVTGTATIQYRPTWSGVHRVGARATGADGSRLTSPEAAETVTGVSRANGTTLEALPITRTWAMPVAVLVVAGVWLTLAAIFLAVVVGIRRAARPTVESGQRTLGQPSPAQAPSEQ